MKLGILATCVVFLLIHAAAWAGTEAGIDFQKDIQPIFEKNCVTCHNPENPSSGLILDSPASLLKGGKKEGPSVVAGQGSKSPLVRYLDGSLEPRMPLGSQPLSAPQIAAISRWIDSLAKPESSGGGAETATASDSPHRLAPEVKALLEKNCLACHSSQKHQSGLVLETMEGLLRGGSLQGPAIVAGQSGRSPLIQRLRGARPPQMPLNGNPLSESEIHQVAAWIDALKAPAVVQSDKASKKVWPWTPVTEPAVPAVKNEQWVRNPIDAFILAKLEQKKLTPAPPVSARGLLRRLYVGLIGLPPTPDEMDRFLENPSREAYSREVEKLLADPRYGEKWGRHWLDLVRYSDTRGGAIDYPRPHMWRYRDYVIRAFNQDRPYDRFIKEQLAGDAISIYGAEGKLGLGFLGQWVEVEAEGEQPRRDYMVDVVDTTASVFLGLTLGCARCHDHKYDPLPTKDYYRLEAFFSPMKVDVQDIPFHQYELPQLEPDRWKKAASQWADLLAERQKAGDDFKEQIKKRQSEQEILFGAQDLKDWADPGQRKLLVPGDTLLTQQEKDRLKLIGRQTARFANPNSPDYYLPKAYVVADSQLTNNIATYLLAGGNYKIRSEEVKPGFLSAITGNQNPVALDGLVGSRRKLLAQWIASRENPLTARVMVNRIWQYHFGRGLVATPSDLGKNGAGTVHPDLVDWLAWRFMESGWSVKEIQRLILNSNVYQEAMTHPQMEASETIDPENQYLWIRDPIRMDVEAIRDSILAASGQLNPAMGGPPFFPEANDEQMARAATWWEPSAKRERNRRTVYMLQIRSFQLPMVKVFDGANMDQSCVVRGVTSVTPQVFALFNSEFSHEQSEEMAKRIVGEVGADPEKQVERAFRLAFQRQPSPSDKEMALAFLRRGHKVPEYSSQLQHRFVPIAHNSRPKEQVEVPKGGSLADLCLVLLNMNEFIFLE